MMGIFNWISSVGAWALSGVRTLGNFSRFLFRLVVNLGPSFTRFQDTLKQLYFVGNYSLVIILVSGLFVGFVLGLQGDYVLSSYGSEQALGVLVALSLLRELGPVVTALLFAGRAGTSLTAEIGLMKAGEQLSAMEMMAVDPVKRILAPRFWAGLITMPLLAAVFSAVGIMGGWLVGVVMIGVDSGAFWGQMQSGVDWWADLGNGVMKSFVFGLAVMLISALLLVIGNTIRLHIENRRVEIEVIKLVGGTDAYVRRPFLYMGALYGLGAGVLAWGILAFGLNWLNDAVVGLAGLYGSDFALAGVPAADGLSLLLGAVLLGYIGAWIAVARHLRELAPK